MAFARAGFTAAAGSPAGRPRSSKSLKRSPRPTNSLWFGGGGGVQPKEPREREGKTLIVTLSGVYIDGGRKEEKKKSGTIYNVAIIRTTQRTKPTAMCYVGFSRPSLHLLLHPNCLHLWTAENPGPYIPPTTLLLLPFSFGYKYDIVHMTIGVCVCPARMVDLVHHRLNGYTRIDIDSFVLDLYLV